MPGAVKRRVARQVKRREASIEGACRKLAEECGFMLKKLTDKVGDPDRVMFMYGGRIALIEFKRPGEAPTPIQVHRAGELRALGFDVYTVDSVDEFRKILDRYD